MQNIKKEGEYYEDQKQHRVSGLWPVCFVQRPYHANGGGENEPSHSDLSGDQRNHRIYLFQAVDNLEDRRGESDKAYQNRGKGDQTYQL